MSSITDSMFSHMMGGIGGVAFADEVVEGETTGRQLIKIEPISKNNSSQAGKERWTVQHATGKRATYIVTWSGAQFEVVPEKKIRPKI